MKKINLACSTSPKRWVAGFLHNIVNLANSLVDDWDVYIGFAVRNQTPKNYREYFDERVNLIEVKNFVRSTSARKAIKA